MIRDDRYYQLAREASSRVGAHSGLLFLKRICSLGDHRRILDVGCGEGTRLDLLLPPHKAGWGIDISRRAITLAKRQYPHHRFVVADALHLPFPHGHFDVVYTAFALEHYPDPEGAIREIIRVTKSGGWIVILCPNYGAPNRRSPVSTQNPYSKFATGMLSDVKLLFASPAHLGWQAVVPRSVYINSDDDTVVEPYLYSLTRFMESCGVAVIKSSSLWDLEKFSFHPRKLLTAFGGRIGVWPVKYWGPQVFVAGQKI